MTLTKSFLVLLLSALSACAGCSDPPRGACEVAFDFPVAGTACAEVIEDQCAPPFASLMGAEKTAFTAGATCASKGFDQGGCPNTALMWTFPGSCPGGY